jgi:acyl carrier protein
MSENHVTVPDGELRDLVAEALDLPVDEITEEASFVDDLEVDSLTTLEIVVRLEKRYGVKVAEEDFSRLTSLAGVRELLAHKLAAQAG